MGVGVQVVVAGHGDEEVDVALGDVVRQRAAAAVQVSVHSLVEVVHQRCFCGNISAKV